MCVCETISIEGSESKLFLLHHRLCVDRAEENFGYHYQLWMGNLVLAG